MTADPALRRSRTRRGALVAGILVVVAFVASIVGISTLRTSEVGEAVEVDDRVRVEFPSTPSAALAVVDDDDRLTSLAIATLSPDGTGGSLVTVPVNLDTSFGFGEERIPLNGRPVVADDPDNLALLTADLESSLQLTLPHTVVLSAADVESLVEPFAPLRVDLPEAVIDAGADDAPELAVAGAQDVDAELMGDLFTAIDISGDTYGHHPTDVALWQGLADAANADSSAVEVPLDEFDRPVEPVDGFELLDRLFSGQVGVRDVAIDRVTEAQLPNADDVDVVLLDQFDVLLVFAQIAPALVSTPNESLTFQIIAPFSEEQVAELGDGITTEFVVRQLIGELVFAEGNVVSVITEPQPDGAGETTRLAVANAEFIDAVEEVGPILFGEIDVSESTRVIDGVDVVAVLGTDFLVRRAEILAGDDPDASFAPEEDEGQLDGTEIAEDESSTSEPADVEPAEQAPVDGESGDGTDVVSDTVVTDE